MAITPIYKHFDHASGKWLFALAPDDFEKVRQGYACPNCLEDFGGMIRMKCPVCPHVRDVDTDFVATPQYMLPETDG